MRQNISAANRLIGEVVQFHMKPPAVSRREIGTQTQIVRRTGGVVSIKHSVL